MKRTLLSTTAALALAIGLAAGLWLSSLYNDAAIAQNTAIHDGIQSSEETRTIELFDRSRGSVVNINTLGRRVDLLRRRVFEVREGSGSGFFWDAQGHIVTNFHVIRRAEGIEVLLADQPEPVAAQLIGVSPSHDLAVLKVETTSRIDALPHGDSARVRVGQTVLAIGNPFGLDHTLTRGVVSALNREIQALNGRTIGGVIQTDAAVNPGNSGGPLLDSSGRVVGVNTAILSPAGASIGIAFAVPIDTLKRVVPQLIQNGRYIPPQIGIRYHDPTSANYLGRLGLRGVLILEVEPGSPAEAAGLEGSSRRLLGRVELGDVILAVDGNVVTDSNDLQLVLEQRAPGDTVALTVWNDGERRRVEVTLR
ncbi:S1C family serine protease [Mucisphaera sp.]|uniref:S1C family serine protease n=1 Tax=Mucisphaera sp. TaxID=2913024 RepID=UPI003D0E408F